MLANRKIPCFLESFHDVIITFNLSTDKNQINFSIFNINSNVNSNIQSLIQQLDVVNVGS